MINMIKVTSEDCPNVSIEMLGTQFTENIQYGPNPLPPVQDRLTKCRGCGGEFPVSYLLGYCFPCFENGKC